MLEERPSQRTPYFFHLASRVDDSTNEDDRNIQVFPVGNSLLVEIILII